MQYTELRDFRLLADPITHSRLEGTLEGVSHVDVLILACQWYCQVQHWALHSPHTEMGVVGSGTKIKYVRRVFMPIRFHDETESDKARQKPTSLLHRRCI